MFGYTVTFVLWVRAGPILHTVAYSRCSAADCFRCTAGSIVLVMLVMTWTDWNVRVLWLERWTTFPWYLWLIHKEGIRESVWKWYWVLKSIHIDSPTVSAHAVVYIEYATVPIRQRKPLICCQAWLRWWCMMEPKKQAVTLICTEVVCNTSFQSQKKRDQRLAWRT